MLEARKARGDVPVGRARRHALVVPQSTRPAAREWEQAVSEGREEQLRIENWMKARPPGRRYA